VAKIPSWQIAFIAKTAFAPLWQNYLRGKITFVAKLPSWQKLPSRLSALVAKITFVAKKSPYGKKQFNQAFLLFSPSIKHSIMVSIIMGSDSDLNIMKEAAQMLQEFGIPFELTIVSAHRTPQRMFDYASTAKSRGIKVIIAGAGGAAHLPGMVASITPLPVIGVPIKSSNSIDGWDSILSILQMPNGIPVATVALNAAKNAGILAASILGTSSDEISNKIAAYKKQLQDGVIEKVYSVRSTGWPNEFDKPV
jgi:5-(carboxyamino)imidazole ribonucleotide mutase